MACSGCGHKYPGPRHFSQISRPVRTPNSYKMRRVIRTPSAVLEYPKQQEPAPPSPPEEKKES